MTTIISLSVVTVKMLIRSLNLA